MSNRTAVRALTLTCCLTGCTSSFFSPAEPLLFDNTVEYVEVGSLVLAEENIRVPLGPGRSYWFDGTDGSRWASDVPIVPGPARVLIWHDGRGLVNASGSMRALRHVAGPRNLKRGWYGRVVEKAPSREGFAAVTLEDGRRFEVSPAREVEALRPRSEVIVSEDASRIFVLGSGEELVVSRELAP